MINKKLFGIILLLLSLLGLAGFALTSGNTQSASTLNNEEQLIDNTPSANADNAGTSVTLEMAESQVTGSKFSGDVLTCTNITDVEQVIDLRISNPGEDNISISIDHPFSRTIELSPDQIKRIDLPLLYGVSSISLSGNDEKLTLQVPPCISRGGSSGDSQSSLSSSTELPFQPPPPVPELSTISLIGIGMVMIFIIRRNKQ